ncbi:tautomerase family protein [Tsukamurella sp. M9C]|uniref:tautomerase family protein n=1 Tax=unclassified Tsukamurella TaxID=2633480 RepID=UPI001CCB29E0|nr:tautomerase family protein [Tsukamurella sp. M9C]MCA0155965.1 tautomerase family protein [Tsukamurella sp. M9C]
MPMIQLTASAGALTGVDRAALRATLESTLLRWEGAPDTPFFRAQAWSSVAEADFGSSEDALPRFRVDVTVPQGALSERRLVGLVDEATRVVLHTAGLSPESALQVWVLVHEQPEGTWGAGGGIVRFAELKQIAAAQRAEAADA